MSIHKIEASKKATLPRIGAESQVVRPRFLNSSIKILDQIGFIGLLATIALAVIPYGTVDAWWQAVFECAVFGLTAIWIIEALLRGSWEIRRVMVVLPMFLLSGYAFLQSSHLPFVGPGDGPIARHTLTIDEYQTHLTAVKILTLTLCAALLLQKVTTLSRLKWLVRLIVGIGFGSALFGIARQVLQAPTSDSGFILPFLFPGLGYGQFLSSNAFAFVVEMGFAVVLGLILGGGVARQHILIYIVLGVIIWAALVLSNSRGGLIGFVCQTIFVSLVANPRLFKRFAEDEPNRKKTIGSVPALLMRGIAILAIVVALIASVFWMGGQQLASKIAQGDAVNTTTEGGTRTEIWHSTWQLIKHHPWTGVGFGTYFLAIPQFQNGSGRLKLEQAHNDYLDLAANGGIVAIIIALSLIGLVIWNVRLALRSTDRFRRAAALAGLAGLISVAVHSFVDFGLQVTGIGVIAVSLIVISVANIPIDRRTVHISRIEQ